MLHLLLHSRHRVLALSPIPHRTLCHALQPRRRAYLRAWFISWSYAHYPGSLATISAEPSILLSLFLDESQTPSDSSFMILEGWMTDTAGSGPVSVGWLEYTVWKDGKSYSAETCLLLHSRGVVLITDVSAAAGPQDGLVNCTPG